MICQVGATSYDAATPEIGCCHVAQLDQVAALSPDCGIARGHSIVSVAWRAEPVPSD
jgi:hypothetical protein